MDIYVKLFLIALIPVVLSVFVYLLQQKTKFGQLSYRYQQLIIGIIFGIAAIIGTEWGVNVNGATANVRDAGPLCAGLFFGAPAGIIAGIIGGVERWFAVLWGAGEYSRLACSVSTILAGLFAAFLRKYMFEDKHPLAIMAGIIGVVMEVVHMTIFFLTKLNDVNQVLSIMRILTLPMIFCNGIALFLSVLAIACITGTVKQQFTGRNRISEKIQYRLILCVLVAYAATTGFVYILQTNQCLEQADVQLKNSIHDVSTEIKDISDNNLLTLTESIANDLNKNNSLSLSDLATVYQVTEINIVNKEGIITNSTNPDFTGFDMHSGAQSAAFLVLLDRVESFVQDYSEISFNSEISRKYAGVRLNDGRFVQVGLDGAAHRENINGSVKGVTQNWRVGESGYVLVVDENLKIVSDQKEHYSSELTHAGILFDPQKPPIGKRCEGVVYKTSSYYMIDDCEGYYIISVISQDEVMTARNSSVFINSYMQVIVYMLLYWVIFALIKRHVVDKVKGVNRSLSRIIDGDLNEKVHESGSEEFDALSNDINATVDTLKRYIDEAAAKIDQELMYAKTIQAATLPSVFSAFPDYPQFDIYATMNTAKKVGGDFYDFYLLGDHKLAFIMADVSGKGIPAAMFMMTAKTLIKSLAEIGAEVDQVFMGANDELCQNNEAEMFITAWMGVLDLCTGQVSFVNAGHNPPLVYRKGKGFEYLKSKVAFVLAGMEGTVYRCQTFTLEPGDRIYLYTDGVTEATTTDERLYGEDRLKQYLNDHYDESPEAILSGIQKDIDDFVGDAEQFDDITMMMVDFLSFRK